MGGQVGGIPNLAQNSILMVLVYLNKLPCMAEKTVHSLADAGIGEVVKDHHVGVEAVGAELHHLYDRV